MSQKIYLMKSPNDLYSLTLSFNGWLADYYFTDVLTFQMSSGGVWLRLQYLEITDEEFSSQLSSLPQTDVVALQAALEWAACSKQPGSTGVVAVSVDGGEIFLVLEVVHVVVVPLHPAT